MAYFRIQYYAGDHIYQNKFCRKPRGVMTCDMEYKILFTRDWWPAFFRRVKCPMGRASSRQMPHYVELNSGQMPGGCPGRMIALGIDWYIILQIPPVQVASFPRQRQFYTLLPLPCVAFFFTSQILGDFRSHVTSLNQGPFSGVRERTLGTRLRIGIYPDL